MEFQSTNFDAGIVASGKATFKTTVVRGLDKFIVEDTSSSDPAIARGGMELSDFLASKERNHKLANAMSEMRKRLAEQRIKAQHLSLSTLRQKAGFSQRQLAKAMETSQPNIARWEKDPEQMTAKTIHKMASCLNVREQDIHDAMQKSQTELAAI